MPRPFTDEEREILRDKLVGVARSSLETAGIRRTSVEDLVRRVGISKGAFYLLFDSKEDLIVAVFSRVEAEVRAELDALVASEAGTAQERATGFVRFLFDVVERHPLLALLSDPAEAPVLWRAVPEERMAELKLDDDRYFTRVARRMQESGVLSASIDPADVAALPRVALAVAQGRELIGEDGYSASVDLVVGALGRHLAATPDP